jgi:4-amino-4-deoxy-L-arabinose transferase-like glycosyltransferase
VLYKNKSIKLILWGWIVFLVAVNVLWLSWDKNPPAWDQAAHLKSIVLTNQWLSGKFSGNFVDLVKIFGGYPPLIYVLGGLWSLVVGVSVAKISFLNTIFLVGAVIGVYKLAEEISKNKKIALLSGIIFSLLPVIGDISRNMLLDLPLLVWVAWGLFFWIKSENLKVNKYSLGLLLMLILASLTKLNGFIYFVPMGIILLIENFREKEFWMKMVIGGAIYAVTVGWWWKINIINIYLYLTGLAGQGEAATDPMNLEQWQTWIHYLRLFFYS